MKSNVTVEELNAATILLTGIPVNQLVEVHIAGSAVTAISGDDAGNLTAHRVMIGNPTPPVVEHEGSEDVEILEESPEESPEETDEGDGS